MFSPSAAPPLLSLHELTADEPESELSSQGTMAGWGRPRASILIHLLALGLIAAAAAPSAALVKLIPLSLLDLLHLIRIPAEGASKLAPGLEGHGDGVAVGRFHLAHPQEHAVLVAAHVEEEALGVHRDGGALG